MLTLSRTPAAGSFLRLLHSLARFASIHPRSRLRQPPARATAELAEATFHSLLEYVLDAIVIGDRDGRVMLVNSQAEALFGYQRAQLVGQPVEILLPERFHPIHRRHRAGYVAAHRARPMGAGLDLYARRKDGSEFPVEVSLSPVLVKDDLLVMSAIRDITERKQAEAARVQLVREQAARAEAETIAQQLRLLQTITDTALTHLTLDDLLHELVRRIQQVMAADTAVILLAAPEGDRLIMQAATWLERDRLRGADIPFGEGFAGRLAAERRPLTIGDVDQATILSPRLREEGVRSLLGVPLLAEGSVVGVLHVGKRTVHHFTDGETRLLQLVADRVALAIRQAHLYEAEREARAEAEVASRVKDEFLSTAAHELKTPISSMKAYAQLLMKRGAADQSEVPTRALASINRQCDRLARLVQDLLEVSRLALGNVELRRQSFALETLVSDVVARMQALSPAHRLRLTIGGSATLEADPDRIDQVLVNLLGNAIKFTPGGGPIDVRMSVDAGQVVVAVQDPGIGIAPEHQARVFERFYRAHDAGQHHCEGMGIGLHLSREMVRQHGGEMWFTSECGVGSTFSFSLPVIAGARDDGDR
jgi:PAS domain S-box-containing protein